MKKKLNGQRICGVSPVAEEWPKIFYRKVKQINVQKYAGLWRWRRF